MRDNIVLYGYSLIQSHMGKRINLMISLKSRSAISKAIENKHIKTNTLYKGKNGTSNSCAICLCKPLCRHLEGLVEYH